MLLYIIANGGITFKLPHLNKATYARRGGHLYTTRTALQLGGVGGGYRVFGRMYVAAREQLRCCTHVVLVRILLLLLYRVTDMKTYENGRKPGVVIRVSPGQLRECSI